MSFLIPGAIEGAVAAASLSRAVYAYKNGMMSRKRTRSGHQASQSSKKAALSAIRSSSESATDKRLPAENYRLNSAKYLSNLKGLGPLKDLFYPLITDKLDFGFVSNNGIGVDYYDYGSPNASSKALAPRGNYRGVAFFTLRHTDLAAHRNTEFALNASRFTVRKISSTLDHVKSAYRRFTSAPLAGLGTVAQTLPSFFTQYDAQDSGSVRVLPVGINLAELEDTAWGSSNFVPSALSVGGAIGNSGTEQTSSWTGTLPIIQRTAESDIPYYPASVKDAVMRIADGYLYLDITNTSKTHAVIEVVIHSHKKLDGRAASYNQLYDELHTAYNRYSQQLRPNLTTQNANENHNVNGNIGGGWQTMYDPNVPFLSCPSKFRKKVDDIARECHRSNHVLASGQSKEVKIALGGLYYSLGNKTETPTTVDPLSDVPIGGVISSLINAGMLSVGIGHTGFQALESFVYSSGSGATYKNADGTALAVGSGFWTGKTFSPSSIAVAGKYSESFYPMYIASHNRILSGHSPLCPSGVLVGTETKPMPLHQLTADHVTTTEDSHLGRPVLGTDV
jgi:hypothetical protein